jgi:hypothetical protein
MYLVPFVTLFPEQGEQETRVITTYRHEILPDDEYALAESYCTDPQCNCRRVMLSVLPKRQAARGIMASISFSFDPKKRMAAPFLDPINPQSEYAETFLELVTGILENDPAYVARLERHYQQVKTVAVDPTHSVYQKIARLKSKVGRKSAGRAKTKRKPRPKPKLAGKKKRKKRKRR